MTRFDRASVTVGVILVGIVLMTVLDVPPRTFEWTALGTPLSYQVTGPRVASLLLVALTCAGTEATVRLHPLVRRRVVARTSHTWVLPSMATLATVLVLPHAPNAAYWLSGLAIGGSTIAWLMLVEYQLLDTLTESAGRVETARTLVAHLLALALFVSIYGTRVRSLVTATSISVSSLLISLSVLRSPSGRVSTQVLVSGAIGLLMGEAMWALNYWRASALTVGVLLMLTFYVLIGVARAHIAGSLSRRVLVEFLGVAVVGVWIAVRFSPQA